MKLADLAAKTDCVIDSGDPDLEISSTAGMDLAGDGDVTFLANPKYVSQLKETRASAIFLNSGIEMPRVDIAVLRTKDPYLAYTRAMRLFFPEPEVRPFIHPTAVIDRTASLGDDVEIHANAVIGPGCNIASKVRIMANVTIYDNVRIGENSTIHSGVAVRERTVIGERVVIFNNAVIGCDGFGYAKDEQ